MTQDQATIETELDTAKADVVVEKDQKAKGKARSKSSKKKTNKPQRQVPRGCAYITVSYNNTIITLTDLNGEVLSWSSAGHMGFAGAKKATPYAAVQIVRDVTEKAQPFGLREVSIFVKGIGNGRESAIRTFNACGLTVLGIKDVTPIPHNGPRAPRPRRV